jgi:hypothetical protein
MRRLVACAVPCLLTALLVWLSVAAAAAIDCPPCSDGDPCTVDTCNTATGACVRTNACEDHNDCTSDLCSASGTGFSCSSLPRNFGTCEDGNPCTQGTRCFSGQCRSPLYTDFICSDSSACTGTDLCAAGVCSSGPPANCDDGNSCTSDTCDVVLGCRHVPNTNACDDGLACTVGDACLNGACVGTSACPCEDVDGDGFLDCTVPGCQGGAVPCGDCDDHDPSVHPGASETCNQRDDDCDGRADDGSAIAWFTRRIRQPQPASSGFFGVGVRPVGDMTGDGIPELATLGSQANGILDLLSGADGSRICRATEVYGGFDGIADITGDGVRDLITGGNRKALFISGADCSAIKSCTDSAWYVDNFGEFPYVVQIHQDFGSNVAGLGDLDGDSIPDVVVGDRGANPYPRIGTPFAGMAVILSGANCRVIGRAPGSFAGDTLSSALAPIGDVNGDRVTDVAAGAPQLGRSYGYIRILSGADGAALRTISGTNNMSGQFGSFVSSGADLNGDGVSDIVSWERQLDSVTSGYKPASITVHSGATGALVRRCTDPQNESIVGVLVGDMTGDGVSDIAAGVSQRDTPQGIDAGEIEILSGADCGVFRHLQDREGGEAGAGLGESWPAGDLNHDGWPDLVAGVPGDDVGGVVNAGSILYFISEPDCDGDGIGIQGGDCDDADPARAPGRPEICDGRDNDCDGAVDEGAELADTDADGHNDCLDNCPGDPNPDQADADADGIGDACDTCPDGDHDGACCPADNCCDVANADQADTDADGLGESCDACPRDPANDADLDQVCGDADNCPNTTNADQHDADADGAGDVCDSCPLDSANDIDADGRCADSDNCATSPNPGQEDGDGDALGDACDNCPTVSNPDQNPCVCGECAPIGITISLHTEAGRGTGLLRWSTGLEHDIVGFNVVTLTSRGARQQLNAGLIPCVECATDRGHDYAFLLAKHKSARALYVEQVAADGTTTVHGPAVRTGNLTQVPAARR